MINEDGYDFIIETCHVEILVATQCCCWLTTLNSWELFCMCCENSDVEESFSYRLVTINNDQYSLFPIKGVFENIRVWLACSTDIVGPGDIHSIFPDILVHSLSLDMERVPEQFTAEIIAYR